MVKQSLEKINLFLDGLLDHGSEDDLFAAGYLRGHIDFAAMHLNDDHSQQNLVEATLESLNQAFANNELSEPDQGLVLAMWQRVQHESLA